MSQLKRLAFIGNSLPRRCGIATFTTDLQQAIAGMKPAIDTAIVAMTDFAHSYEYPPVVKFRIDDQDLMQYTNAAHFLNRGNFDAVSLQHEFGIFGGEAGGHILELLSQLTLPVITTLHTVLEKPNAEQRRVLNGIVAASTKVVVMAEKARQLLESVYGVPAGAIEVIAHGIPNSAFGSSDLAKVRLGFEHRAVILTFGLLSPNKGIEVMIDAMPLILDNRPDAVYVVLGATHPNLVRREGEGYRESLIARARARGVEHRVVFLDQFVDRATLLDFISMCDVYVTPYLNEAQMTSGTLAYSFGMGKAVVSTPYWHACELLADGRGVLVPFNDSHAIGLAIAGLLTDEARRQALCKRAYASGRPMTWERTAQRYAEVFEQALAARAARKFRSSSGKSLGAAAPTPPSIQLRYLMSMCDDTGLYQHAVRSIPDRSHGYCIDDNARALLLACALNHPDEEPLAELLVSRLAAFVQHAWNGEERRFRNFMSFGRQWLDVYGSEDCHGRTLWALGECAAHDASVPRREWAATLFADALPAVEQFRSPRAWAFALLGLEGYGLACPQDESALRMKIVLADKLMAILTAVESHDWIWFEDGLAYDNARLPQALLVTGVSLAKHAYLAAGLRSLEWLMNLQRSECGFFRPVGSQTFGDKRLAPRAFDQQPLEAAASISACLAAWRVSGEARWAAEAERAFAWFNGSNDLSSSLVDAQTGSCCDGLHPDRVNQNRGGESVVSYLLSVAEIRGLARERRKTAQRLTSASPVELLVS